LTFVGSPGILGGVNEDKASPLGEWLRQHREELDISLEQAEEETRIRARYLEALEAEEFDKLPGPVVGRGFLRNYAVYLELDPQEAADRYSALVAPPEPESLSVDEPTPFTTGPFRPVALHEMANVQSNRGWLIALVAVILVIALAILIWLGYPFLSKWFTGQAAGLSRPTATQSPTKAALATATKTTVPTTTTAPPTATVTEAAAITPTLGTATLEPTPTLTLTPSPSPSPSAVIYTGIFMELILTDTSWIQVSTDGMRQFQGELEADTYRSWYGEKRIALIVGNAGAVIVTVNGQLIGTLGAPGEVVERVFELVDDEVTEATTTPAPTGSVTEEPTLEPTVTPASSALEPTTTITPPLPITPTGTITATATITPTLTITPTATP
jgi:cytoskeletal protein RodZ